MKSRPAEIDQFSFPVLLGQRLLEGSSPNHGFIHPKAPWNLCSWVSLGTGYLCATVATHWISGKRQTVSVPKEGRTDTRYTHLHPSALPCERFGWHFVIWFKFWVFEFYLFPLPPIWKLVNKRKKKVWIANLLLWSFQLGKKPNSIDAYMFILNVDCSGKTGIWT